MKSVQASIQLEPQSFGALIRAVAPLQSMVRFTNSFDTWTKIVKNAVIFVSFRRNLLMKMLKLK